MDWQCVRTVFFIFILNTGARRASEIPVGVALMCPATLLLGPKSLVGFRQPPSVRTPGVGLHPKRMETSVFLNTSSQGQGP